MWWGWALKGENASLSIRACTLMLKYIIGYFLVSTDFYDSFTVHGTNGQLKV
jgi:hypothetical protein